MFVDFDVECTAGITSKALMDRRSIPVLWRKYRSILAKQWREGGSNGNYLMRLGRRIDQIDTELHRRGGVGTATEKETQARAAELNWSSKGCGPY